MSKKVVDQQAESTAVPFFAHLLNGQSDPAAAGPGGPRPQPTYHCLDSECTKKYPSDDDESTTWLGDADG
jgi:hypothetical protein